MKWIISLLLLVSLSLGGCVAGGSTPVDTPRMTAVEVCEYVGEALTAQEPGEYTATSASYLGKGKWTVEVKRTLLPSRLDIVKLTYYFDENTAKISR